MSSCMAPPSTSFCKQSSAPFPKGCTRCVRHILMTDVLSLSLLYFGRCPAKGAMVTCCAPPHASSCSPLRARCSRWVLSLSCYKHLFAINNSRSCSTRPVPHCGRPTAPVSSRPSSRPSLVSSWALLSISVVLLTLPPNQYILSEVVCAWRAAVLWNYDRRVVAVLMVFLIGATCECYLPIPCLLIR